MGGREGIAQQAARRVLASDVEHLGGALPGDVALHAPERRQHPFPAALERQEGDDVRVRLRGDVVVDVEHLRELGERQVAADRAIDPEFVLHPRLDFAALARHQLH